MNSSDKFDEAIAAITEILDVETSFIFATAETVNRDETSIQVRVKEHHISTAKAVCIFESVIENTPDVLPALLMQKLGRLSSGLKPLIVKRPENLS